METLQVTKQDLVFKKEKEAGYKFNIIVVLKNHDNKTVCIEAQKPYEDLPSAFSLEEKEGLEIDDYPVYSIPRP